MPYLVKVDELTVPKAHSSVTNPATGEVQYAHTGATYAKGTIIADEDVSPVVQKLVEDGDIDTLEYVKDDPAGHRNLVDIVPVAVESAAPGRVLPAEAAALVPDPPGAEIDQSKYADLPEAATPGRVRVDEAAASVPDPPRPVSDNPVETEAVEKNAEDSKPADSKSTSKSK